MTVIFENQFLLLSPKQQQIWNVLWWFSNKYRNSFPSHAKIALLAKCCPRTVRTALKKFADYGWLESIRRAYRSSIYCISNFLLKINPRNRSNYLKPNENYEHGGGGGSTSNLRDKLQHILPHIECSQKNTERSNVHQSKPSIKKPEPKVKYELEPLPFPKGNKLDIQKNFPEQVIDLAIESYKSYKKPMWNPLGLFYRLCGIENKKYKEKKKNGS